MSPSTQTVEDAMRAIVVDSGVYHPQEDSRLLVDTLRRHHVPTGKRVLDLCTGSGVVAIAAALSGASEVVAVDISAKAVACAQRNADALGAAVTVVHGPIEEARSLGTFDIVVSNPPYVPAAAPVPGPGVHVAWNAGVDGRSVLDPICRLAHDLLSPGGTILLVQSEYSSPATTVEMLAASGFTAEVLDRRTVDFGPVMHDRADWLEETGVLDAGRRREDLVVVRGVRQ